MTESDAVCVPETDPCFLEVSLPEMDLGAILAYGLADLRVGDLAVLRVNAITTSDGRTSWRFGLEKMQLASSGPCEEGA